MIELTDENRLNLVKKTVLISFIIGIGLSFKLWISSRDLPLVPVFDFLNFFHSPIDYLFIGILILLLLSAVFIDKTKIGGIVLISFTFLLLQDQNRCQPWVYIYLLFLIPFSFPKSENNSPISSLTFLQIILIGVYFWSGIQKVNSQFIEIIFRSILTSFFKITDGKMIDLLLPFGYLIPLIEFGAPITLLFLKTRKVGICLLLLMHVFILLYVSPLGINANTTVISWNISMMLFIILLFYRFESQASFTQLKELKIKLIIVLCWILPLFNFVGYWDNYLSFSLFTGKTNKYYICVSTSEFNKVNKKYQKYAIDIENLKTEKWFDVSRWSYEELNVPFYPESRTFHQIAKSFCEMGIDDDKMYFMEMDLSNNKNNFEKFRCSNLED